MHQYLNIADLVIGVILMTLILLQNRGTSLGGAFGGEGEVFGTKRGLEKTLYITTIVLAVLFLGAALANIIVS